MLTSRQQGRLFNIGKGRMCRRHLEIYERATKWASQTKRECSETKEIQVGRSKDVNGIKMTAERHPKEYA
eukprot:971528-Pleurochrysis_carterae.AAC.1